VLTRETQGVSWTASITDRKLWSSPALEKGAHLVVAPWPIIVTPSSSTDIWRCINSKVTGPFMQVTDITLVDWMKQK